MVVRDFDKSELVRYLKLFDINVIYNPPDFSEGRREYASIELTTKLDIKAKIVREINSRLNSENGFRARLRIIDYGTKKGDKMYYCAEIVPDDRVREEEMMEETIKFLRSLPKAIRNVAQQKRN